MSGRARIARRALLASWIGLLASVTCWALPGVGTGAGAALVAGLPLLLPLPGIARGARRVLRAAPMALAPALALSVTELIANPPARPFAGATLALVFAGFAGVLAALRSLPPD
jgi:uncharacterized membrane protein